MRLFNEFKGFKLRSLAILKCLKEAYVDENFESVLSNSKQPSKRLPKICINEKVQH